MKSKSGEIRMNEVFLAGRLSRDPIRTEDGRVHFMFDCERGSAPFHCVCTDRTAENLLEHCQKGDEFSIEGELGWIDFPNTGKTMIILTRYVSYGRKLRGLAEGTGHS